MAQTKEFVDASHALNDLSHAIALLESKNDKLREICIDAHEWMSRALYDGSARRYEYESITERMHELGLEVDG